MLDAGRGHKTKIYDQTLREGDIEVSPSARTGMSRVRLFGERLMEYERVTAAHCPSAMDVFPNTINAEFCRWRKPYSDNVGQTRLLLDDILIMRRYSRREVREYCLIANIVRQERPEFISRSPVLEYIITAFVHGQGIQAMLDEIR